MGRIPGTEARAKDGPLLNYRSTVRPARVLFSRARDIMTAIDLFAGLGGWTLGAQWAGVRVIWAANHWPEAVRWHSANHPDTEHSCQDLHQANWSHVPRHDLLLASPACQGHT